MDREPAVAGSFYPADPARLAREVAALVGPAPAAAPRPALGVLAPHAGYVYSGAVAGATYARVAVPERALVLCPNHTGRGARVALWPAGGAWETPLGRVTIDADLTASLGACPLVEEDRDAHLVEHALEVQLPFLQVLRPGIALAALCLGPLSAREEEQLGHAISDAVRRRPLDRLLALDALGLRETVHRERISMCGVVPATVMLVAARDLGAREAELVSYSTSGDVTGDRGSVVGYAGAIVR
jgi:AmmeMemoRadiSam system protein B